MLASTASPAALANNGTASGGAGAATQPTVTAIPRLGLRRETRPLPREWRLLCPWDFVHLVLHSLPGSGPRLAP